MYSNRVLEIWLEKWGDRYPLDQKQRRDFLTRNSLYELRRYEEWVIKKVIENNQKLDAALSEAQYKYWSKFRPEFKKKNRGFRKSDKDERFDKNGEWIEIDQNDECSRRQSSEAADREGSPEGFGLDDGETDWRDWWWR